VFDMSGSCIFCDIASGRAPADVVYDGVDTIFFRDISPQAKVHILGIMKRHVDSMDCMKRGEEREIGKLMVDAVQVAKEQGLSEDGYRILTNVGRNASPEVGHLHIHILGGEKLGGINQK
jgi:histidine triad (HIT) family protein